MAPADNQALTPTGQGPPQPGGPQSIQLSLLIEYILQRTYHELCILSELLPRKTDIYRKIEIVQFASRTRQLFVRLLALVKWANSASKVDKCAMILSFLDQQCMLFVETADMLAKMSRETLVLARLPSFCLPSAIDVLTTGTYPRLPTCIKEKIVPPDPITNDEKRQTLGRLNQIIEYRLVTSDLPRHMRQPKIQNGRVRFHVPHEFEVTLTLMEDGPNIPWRLLDIEILVEDPETGDGKALVHSLQVNYIHQLVQSRLMDNDNRPLHDLYNVLHSFCQSLQLGVLHSQSTRLISHRLGEHVRIEGYKLGKSLLLSYWWDPTKRDGKSRPQTIYKLRIHVDDSDPDKPLQVTHFPQIQGSESTKVAQAIRSDHLSVEKLLMHTVQVRSLAKLKELEREFRLIVPGPCEIRDLPTVLYVPVVYPCMMSEMLCVSVDIMKGQYLVSIAEKETSMTSEIQDCINADKRDLRKLLKKLRLRFGLQRCHKSIQYLQMPGVSHLPLINVTDHPLEKLGPHKLFIKLPKQPEYYIVVEVYETPRKAIDYRFFLLQVSSTTFDPMLEENMTDVPTAYLKAGHMAEIDKFLSTHDANAPLYDLDEEEPNHLARKRKLLLGDSHGPSMKKVKYSPYFVPELTHILAMTEDRIPFVMLGEELHRRGIQHQGVQVDEEGTGFCLGLLEAPINSSGISDTAAAILKDHLLACKFRTQKGRFLVWMVESVFTKCPVTSTKREEQGPIHRVQLFYGGSSFEPIDKTVQSFLDDWMGMAKMYEAVLDFAHVYNANIDLQTNIEVQSFSYKRLTLAYGPNKCYSVLIQYRQSDQQFHLAFGTRRQCSLANCHILVAKHLQKDLNSSKSIAQLAQVLVDTWGPLSAVGKLNITPVLGIGQIHDITAPMPIFSIVPQLASHIRVVFRNCYCIEIFCQANGVVGVRDGAFSMFDTREVVEGMNPISGIKSFLSKYVDDSVTGGHARRRSTTEDDNPPSPVGMDTMDNFMSQGGSTSSPSSRQKDSLGGLRFHNPMTPPSNPLTPASPGQRLSQVHHTGSPAAGSNFQMAPSPSGMMAPSPGNPILPVASPSGFMPSPSPSAGHLGMHMQSPAPFISPPAMVDSGSPFSTTLGALTSPGTRNWPGSPSVPGPSPASSSTRHGAGSSTFSPGHPALHSPHTQGRDGEHSRPAGSVMSPPSRILPQRSWAASMPTLLSHEALDRLMCPTPLPSGVGGPAAGICSPLERFLSCFVMRRHLVRAVSSQDALQMVQSDVMIVRFKTESLQFAVSFNATTLQSLHLKVTPIQESQWDPEDLQTLEKYFEAKIVCPPYKLNSLTAYCNILGVPAHVLKDCIQIMKIEMNPDRNLKWSLQWCLNNPPGRTLTPGIPMVIPNKFKVVLMMQLTWNGSQATSEPQSIILPTIYDLGVNQLSAMQNPGLRTPAQVLSAATAILESYYEYNTQTGECTIFSAVQELLSKLGTQPGT